MSVKMKPWKMKKKTREIVSEAYNLCKEMYEKYGQKVTIRQIYYYLFSKGIIRLTSKDYKKVDVCLTEARKRGYIPFEWIEDRARYPIWQMLYKDINDFINKILQTYKRDTWANQQNFVIILIEKDALAPIVWDIAKRYNVFVFPTKGFSSWSMFVEDIRELVNYFGRDKNLIVFMLSDLDPSGQFIKKDYINKFKFMHRELGFKKPAKIIRIAITERQVQKYNIPPMQKTYKKKGTINIWELDALDPKILRKIVKKAIEKFVDLKQLNRDLQTEKKEKEILEIFVEEKLEAHSYNIDKGE